MEHPLSYYLAGLSVGIGVSALTAVCLSVFSAVRHLDGDL